MRTLRSANKNNTKAYRYTVLVEPCEEGGYVATCPALAGCHVQGETYQGTVKDMRSVIDAYLEDLRENGEPIPQEDFRITSMTVAAR